MTTPMTSGVQKLHPFSKGVENSTSHLIKHKKERVKKALVPK